MGQPVPEAVVDGGELDIILLRPEGVFGQVQIFVKAVRETGRYAARRPVAN